MLLLGGAVVVLLTEFNALLLDETLPLLVQALVYVCEEERHESVFFVSGLDVAEKEFIFELLSALKVLRYNY